MRDAWDGEEMLGAVKRYWRDFWVTTAAIFHVLIVVTFWPRRWCDRGKHLVYRSTHTAFNGVLFDFEICEACGAGRKYLPWERDGKVLSE
jgi:hypothetical protein